MLTNMTMVFLLLVLVPYCYVLARVASIGYFQAKLQYHNHLVSTMKEEPDGQRSRT